MRLSRRLFEPASAGVDWITVTATTAAKRDRLTAVGERWLDAEADAENARTEWHWRGYDGWKCGSVTLAHREDSTYCQASGSPASTYWLAMLTNATNVPRFDVQVTLCDVPDRLDLARWEWEKLQHDPTNSEKAGWRSWITTHPTGSTLYIGSPKSDRRLRLYDKAAESPTEYPTGAWRYEVQARGGLARAIATGVASSDGHTDACVDTVHQCFSARGVRPRFRPGGGGLLGSSPRTRSDADRRIHWLRTQVAPTIRWLAQHGRDADAARALGLA